MAASALSIALLAYVAYAALFFLIQRKMTYLGVQLEPVPGSIPNAVPGFERVWLGAPDARVEAWFLPAPGDSLGGLAPALIFTHGNAELIDHWPLPMEPLRDMGVSLLLVEYPGYGRSEGTPTETSIVDAEVDAYDWLTARQDVDPERIVAMGRSLGGGPAAALTARRPVAALVLQSTFVSVGALAWQLYRLPPFLAKDRYDNRAAVSAYDGPVLVFHGIDDAIIPFRHGQTLARAARRGRLVTFQCGHNDCPPSWPEYWDEVRAFLTESGVLTGTEAR